MTPASPSARHRRGRPFRLCRHRNWACSSGSVPAFDAALDPFDSGQAGAGSKACRQACTDGQDQRRQAPGRQRRVSRLERRPPQPNRPRPRRVPAAHRCWPRYGDWGVYTAQTGRSKICYALSQPKDRLPKNLNAGPRLSLRVVPPGGERARTRSPWCLASPPRRTARRKPRSATRPMCSSPRTANAWLKNPAEEGQAIATMGSSVEPDGQDAVGPRHEPDRPLFPERLRRPWSAPARNALLKRRSRTVENDCVHKHLPGLAPGILRFKAHVSDAIVIYGALPSINNEAEDFPWRRCSTSPSITPMRPPWP